ncbi:MAG: hypothetical protein E7270_02885 [Lachnospiraceae bacterium]|nr:hypothetical protein [Lachnospiraceae bacterium]
MKRRIISFIVCLALIFNIMQINMMQIYANVQASDPLDSPVYVGGVELKYAGDSVLGTGGGKATLCITQDGSPVIILDNYVYEGAGYKYSETNNYYAGIYYEGNKNLIIFCGPNNTDRSLSQSSITLAAGNADKSYGIYLPNVSLFIGSSYNGRLADSLLVNGGPAIKYSYGIYVGKELITQGRTEGYPISLYTSKDSNSTVSYVSKSNFAISVRGGTVENYSLPRSYGIYCDTARFSGGTINAYGGKVSYEGVSASFYEAATYGINVASLLNISGATVTAKGGACGNAIKDKSNNNLISYGCYGDVNISSGSLTATGADLVLADNVSNAKNSYGIYGSITATGGKITATGGNTINGRSYGVYINNKDCNLSGKSELIAKVNDENIDAYSYGLYVKGNSTITVADNSVLTAIVSTKAEYESSGIYSSDSGTKYVQTGGTVSASSLINEANAGGAYLYSADISGGKIEASAKGNGFLANTLNLTGGEVVGISNNTLNEDIWIYPVGIKISNFVMEGGSLTGQGGESPHMDSYGIYITNAEVSDGTIVGTGGVVSSEEYSVKSYGIHINNLTHSGGTITGTAGDSEINNYGIYISNLAEISNEAIIQGIGAKSEKDIGYGIYGKNISIKDKASVTGIGGNSDSSVGVYCYGEETSLQAGTLTAEGNIGLYAYYDLKVDGTVLTLTGNTSAISGNLNKTLNAEAIIASINKDGTDKSTLAYGGYSISSLAQYRYLNVGTIASLGVTPGKRDIADAIITLGSELTYNGAEQTMEVVSVVLGGEDLLESGYVTVSGNKVTNAGTYTLTITAKEDTHYTGTATVEFTVKRLAITPAITVSGGPYAYKSNIDSSAVIVKYGDNVLVEDKDYTIYSIWTKEVGEDKGYVQIKCLDSSNFLWYGLAEGSFTVVKAENPVVVTTPISVIKGGNVVKLAYTDNEASESPSYEFVGDDLGCTVDSYGYLTSGDITGDVTVRLNFPSDENYTEVTKTIKVTIKEKNRAEIEISMPDTTYNYNDTTTLGYLWYSTPTGYMVKKTVEYEGITRNGDVYARTEEEPKKAGNYTVYLTYETMDTIYTGSDDFVINPKTIYGYVTLGDDLTYNGSPQTQEIEEVKYGDYIFSEEDYDVIDNVQTNAGNYWLTIKGKGNFTGEFTCSYIIKKKMPMLSDFEVPELSPVDYSGDYIEIASPTSTKIGMGRIYVQQQVKNAGTYEITFGVFEGDNYTAASGFNYGTLTINKVERPITTTNSVVGINGNTIDLHNRVVIAGSSSKTYEIVGESKGCSINSGQFISGNEAGDVTVRVTTVEDDNYLETSKDFIVTVVTVGGVKLTGYVENLGNSNDETLIELLQGEEVKYVTYRVGNNPYYIIDGIAAGTYILRVSKKDHVTFEKQITVDSLEDLREDVKLLYIVNSVIANCDDFPTFFTAGETLFIPENGFIYNTQLDKVSVDGNGIWQKKNGDEWEDVAGIIENGAIYRYKTTLKMSQDNSTHTLASAVTLNINDVNWTVDYSTMQNSNKTDANVIVYSPDIIVKYTVSFEAGEGTGEMNKLFGILDEYTLPECNFTAPEGMRFKAWSIGGVEKAIGDIIEITENTVVTAIWEEIPHVHVFDREVVTDAYKVSKATCKCKARYHKSCECGAEGTEIFEYGNLEVHKYNTGVITKQPTEKEKGIKTYTCIVCKATKTEVVPVKEPVKNGTVLKDKNGNSYKVTKTGKANGTVSYVKPKSKKATNIKIPDTVKINGIVYKITSIEKNAFKNNKKITSVTIGKNIKTIGANAFSGCSKLKTVKMGASVTTIGDKAFYKCTSLTKITIPAKVKKIGKSAFYGCKKLKNITIKTKLLNKKKVGKNAFKGINAKANINVPKAKFKIYKPMLKSRGVGKRVKFKKK